MLVRSLSLSAALLASIALFASACSGNRSTEEESSDALEVQKLQVIAARERAHCWIDVTGEGDRARSNLSCKTIAKGNDPLDVSLVITAKSASSRARAVTHTLKPAARGETVASFGSFAANAFPIELTVKMVGSAHSAALIGAKTLELQQKTSIAAPADLAPTAPAIFKLPFDLWPVGLIDTSPAIDFAVRANYAVPIAPLALVSGESELRLEMALTVERGADKRKMVFFPAPLHGDVPVELRAGGDTFMATPVSTPGYFVLTEKGPRPAAPHEILEAFPHAGDEPTIDTPDVDDADDAGDASTAPIDRDPTCGGVQQAACFGSVCDDGTRYDVFARKCLACGDAQQPACFTGADNNGGDPVCNGGTRYDTFGRICLGCGAEGQTFCVDGPHNASGGPVCNTGFHYDVFSRTCIR